MAGIQKLVSVPNKGFVSGAVELYDIPNSRPIREVRFDVRLDNATANLAKTDPFNLVFEEIKLLFDGEVQYSIQNLVELQAISMFYTGKKAEVAVINDTNLNPSGAVVLSFVLPVMWRGINQDGLPQMSVKYSANAFTSRLFRMVAVQEMDTSDFRQFKMQRNTANLGSGGVEQFKPDAGKRLRGAFLYLEDASVTNLFTDSKYPLGTFGGDIGLAKISFTHNGVEYLRDATELDVIAISDRIMGLDSKPTLLAPYTRTGTLASLEILSNPDMIDHPYVFIAEEGDFGGDTIPASISARSAVQPFLFIPAYDIDVTLTSNTVLQVEAALDANLVGSWQSSDKVHVIWVYVSNEPKKQG